MDSLQLKKVHRLAFTLVEMLVVVSIIGIVVTLLTPALKDFGRGSSLQNGGNLITNMITLARQTAMSKNTMTAFVMLGNQGTPEDYRAFTVLEYIPGAGWSQTNPWEVLQQGIIFDVQGGVSASFLENGTLDIPDENKLGIRYNQISIDLSDSEAYAARIFLPSGALRNAEAPAQLRLVEGVKAGKKINYTHRGGTDKAVNFYEVAIVGATGATKISRP